MSELINDLSMKLLGKTILPFPHNHVDLNYELSGNSTATDEEGDKETSENLTTNKQEGMNTNQIPEQTTTATSGISEDTSTPSVDRETSLRTSNNNTENTSQDKTTLKKPDKIIPCPRCNSMDTKFCYYNNYNVNQPRYFCKNCQRYWTSGGTMRNVPVGAGRRKTKNPCGPQYHPIMVSSESLQKARANHRSTQLLRFGSEYSPPCESIASVSNPFQLREKKVVVSSSSGDYNKHDDPPIGFSISESSSNSEKVVEVGNPSQVPCFPGSPWPYSWSSPMPQSAFCPPGFPVLFHPTPPYWPYTLPGPWNFSSPSASGKHSRDGDKINHIHIEKEDVAKENTNTGSCVLVPRTLRIDDPSEAAKSSIWETLGIKNEKSSNSINGGLFKTFQSKGDEENHVGTSWLLHANPAALSRSLNFHESS